MTRRTYQQVQAWRAAAVALLAEVGIEVEGPSGQSDTHPAYLRLGRANLTAYLTGSVSIGGPAADADYLCEPLERHGLLNGWHPGSRGSGVVWVPQREGVPLTVAEVMNHCGPEESARRVAAAKVAIAAMECRPDPSTSEAVTTPGSDVVVRLRAWRDELAASGKPHEVGPWLARELERRFPEVLTADSGSGRVKP